MANAGRASNQRPRACMHHGMGTSARLTKLKILPIPGVSKLLSLNSY